MVHSIKSVFMILIVLFVSTLFESCASKVWLTLERIDEHHLTNQDIRNLQYYLAGGDIVLVQQKFSKQSMEVKHSVKVYENEAQDKIIIEEGTPGIASNVVQNTSRGYILTVDFGDSLFFQFNVSSMSSAIAVSRSSQYMYKDKNYIVTFSGQNSPGLTYKFTHDKTKDYQETKAKGRQF